MRQIRLTPEDVRETDALEKNYLDQRHYRLLVQSDAVVLRPGGRLLLLYARDALPPALWRQARDALSHLRPVSNNRRTAAGGEWREAPTAVLGFLDRDPRTPRCRMTDFVIDNYGAYVAALPLFAAISRAYQRLAPAHWGAQRRFTKGVSADFVIPKTVFTSASLNVDWRTHCHRDTNNSRPGLEAMVVLDGGAGGELIFPSFRVAADVRPGGLLLADMRQWHGNAPLDLRVSVVLYARAGMCDCGTASEEWERAARGPRGPPRA